MKLTDRATLQFKICLYCGHLQNPELGICDECGAGKIGLGKPPELWAYLNFKIEGVLRLPEAERLTLINPTASTVETGGFGMSDKFHLSLESIDNGFIVRGPDHTIYFPQAQAAITKLKDFADVVLKEISLPPKKE